MDEALFRDIGRLGLIFIGLFGVAFVLRRAHLPSLVGFMAAGIVLQGLAPAFLAHALPALGEVAIWLLFFFVGLEYSPENLRALGRSILVPGFIDFGVNFGGVFALASFFTSVPEALLLAAALYPSSTAIVAQLLLDYRRFANPEAELLLGLLIFEDLVGVGLLGLFTPLLRGEAVGGWLLLKTALSIGGVLLVFWVLYRWVLPYAERLSLPLSTESLTVFLLSGLVLWVGAMGHALGLSGALAAFLLGILVPQGTALYKAAESTLLPIRDLSVGLFFFALSYSLEMKRVPLAGSVGWLAVAFLLKGISTYWAARRWGLGLQGALRASLSFLPRGEFSLLFGALSGVWREVIVGVVFLSALVGTGAFASASWVASRFRKRSRAVPPPRMPS